MATGCSSKSTKPFPYHKYPGYDGPIWSKSGGGLLASLNSEKDLTDCKASAYAKVNSEATSSSTVQNEAVIALTDSCMYKKGWNKRYITVTRHDECISDKLHDLVDFSNGIPDEEESVRNRKEAEKYCLPLEGF